MSSSSLHPSFPFSVEEHLLLTQAVERFGHDWEQVSKCVCRAQGDVAGSRSAAACALEYSKLCESWAQRNRVACTAKKLAESFRERRVEQLKRRIRRREDVARDMLELADRAARDKEVASFVAAVATRPSTALLDSSLVKIGKRETWERDEDDGEDDGDGFGPFKGRTRKAAKSAPSPESDGTPEPFDEGPEGEMDDHSFSVHTQSDLSFAGGHWGRDEQSDATLLLAVFESVSQGRAAQPFQEPVTEHVAPGYSSVVKKPVSLRDVREGLHQGTIGNVGQLYHQLMQMVCNAMMFNDKETEVYKKAQHMMEIIKKECEPLFAVRALSRAIEINKKH